MGHGHGYIDPSIHPEIRDEASTELSQSSGCFSLLFPLSLTFPLMHALGFFLMQAGWVGSSLASAFPACHSSLMERTFGCSCASGRGLGNSLSLMCSALDTVWDIQNPEIRDVVTPGRSQSSGDSGRPIHFTDANLAVGSRLWTIWAAGSKNGAVAMNSYPRCKDLVPPHVIPCPRRGYFGLFSVRDVRGVRRLARAAMGWGRAATHPFVLSFVPLVSLFLDLVLSRRRRFSFSIRHRPSGGFPLPLARLFCSGCFLPSPFIVCLILSVWTVPLRWACLAS